MCVFVCTTCIVEPYWKPERWLPGPPPGIRHFRQPATFIHATRHVHQHQPCCDHQNHQHCHYYYNYQGTSALKITFHKLIKVVTHAFSYVVNYPLHPNTENFLSCLLKSSRSAKMLSWLVLRRGCLLEKPNFVVADHHHHAADRHRHVEQDVCAGITRFTNSPALPCVHCVYCNGVLFI